MLTGLLGVIITVVILGLICYCVSLLPLPAPFKTIAYVLFVIVVILYLVSLLHGGTLTI